MHRAAVQAPRQVRASEQNRRLRTTGVRAFTIHGLPSLVLSP
jgi:hypothetical protein